MFGSKRALIRLQIAAWHHRKRETASDRGVVPPEREKNTSQGTCRDWSGEKVVGASPERLFGGPTETKIPKRGTCRARMGEPGRWEGWSASGEAGGGGASPEKLSRAPTRRRVRFNRRPENCAWPARGCSFGAGAFTKVGDLLQALLLVWSVLEKYVARSSPENFTGGECFLTTIRLTGKYWEMEKVTRMKHGHRKVSRSWWYGKQERIRFSPLALIPCWEREKEEKP